MEILDVIIGVVGQLEGSYKWYVIGGAVLLMAAVINKLVFKTLKWVFIFLGVIVIILAFMWQFGYLQR